MWSYKLSNQGHWTLIHDGYPVGEVYRPENFVEKMVDYLNYCEATEVTDEDEEPEPNNVWQPYFPPGVQIIEEWRIYEDR